MRAYGAHSKSVLWHLMGQALVGTFGVHSLQNCFHSTSAGTFGVHGLLNPLQSTPPHELLRNRRFYKGKVDILKRKLGQYLLDFFWYPYAYSSSNLRGLLQGSYCDYPGAYIWGPWNIKCSPQYFSTRAAQKLWILYGSNLRLKRMLYQYVLISFDMNMHAAVQTSGN